MGKLGERIDSLEAVLAAAIVTGLIVVPTLLVARQGLGGLGDARIQPWWMLTGGALGAFIVLSVTIAGPRIGTTAVVGLLIAGQLARRRRSTVSAGSGSTRSGSTGPGSSGSRCWRPGGPSRSDADLPPLYATQSTATDPGKAPIASPRRSSSTTAERPSSP
jgi:Putative inner membrane exporter, YdcZ